jgi:hypothetical protein
MEAMVLRVRDWKLRVRVVGVGAVVVVVLLVAVVVVVVLKHRAMWAMRCMRTMTLQLGMEDTASKPCCVG